MPAPAPSPAPLLDALLGPADLRKLTRDELTQLAGEIRLRIKEVVSAHGGHLASNLGTVELSIALHRVFDFSSDRLLWDVGHQAYPHKLLTGRAARFHTNRQQGGVSGFPDPKESPFDLAKVGHSSTAISTGVGVAEGYRRSEHRRATVVVIGDGALTGGMAYEGLINAGQLKSDLIVVLNDNGQFIDAPTGSMHLHLDRIRTGSMYQHLRKRFLETLKKLPAGPQIEKLAEQLELAAHKAISPGYIFEDLGFRYFGPVDGHDLALTEEALQNVARLKGPILLHVMTRKGGGWQPAVADPLKYHGPKGFDVSSGVFQVKPPARTYSTVFAETLAAIANEDDKTVAITAAMPSGTALRQFGQAHPERMFDVGICEQHSFAFAQGLAIAGARPFLAHYSTFAQRGYDQLFQEVCLSRDLGIVITLDRAGLVGEDGETHHGIYDIAWSRCLPGLVLMAPRDGAQLDAMLRWSHAQRQLPGRPAGYCIRYPKDEVPQVDWGVQPAPLALGKAEILRRGDGNLMVWAYGASVKVCHDAIADLGEHGRGITLVDARFAKPLDGALLAELAAEHGEILTVEDHVLPGGFGSVVAEEIADRGLRLRLHRAGIRDELVPHASREQQLAAHGIDRAGVAKRIRAILGIGTTVIPFTRTA
ncbi:MAG: 1-deoxy-D-xylulose-5-phosphate synthase [Planctomycetes bacterium]|nr:1-deoxy-D-xylulose-5-phosphate synthase [Planctomycetota bacterium]